MTPRGSAPRAPRLARLALALALLAPPARAQDADPAPDGPRRLRVTMARGHATLRLQLAPVASAVLDERLVALAPGAVATAMRVRHDGVWLGSTLRAPGPAEEAFLGLSGVAPGSAPGAWRALLGWEQAGSVKLQLATPPGQASGRPVEIEALAPTVYEEGRERLDLSVMLADGPLTVEVAGGHGDDQLLVDGESVSPGASRAVSQGGQLELVPAERDPLRGSLALAMAGGQTLVRGRLDVPARLSEAPQKASVVVVLDRSRSLSPAEHRAAASLARAYLERLPDARAAVVAFDRSVHALQPALVSVDEAVASLARAPEPRNGSRVDLALDRAAALLEGAPGPRRVLVLTDGLARSALTTEALREVAVRTGAIVHLGLVSEARDVKVDRDDSHRWSGAARATGGLVWTVKGPAGGRLSPGSVEALVRPIAVENIERRWLGAGMKDSDYWPGRLDEGEGHELVQASPWPPGALEVTGELWATRVRCQVAATAGGDALWTKLAVGSKLLDELDEGAQRDLARRAQVVSPHGSLLAVGPGLNADLREFRLVLSGSGGGSRTSGRLGGSHRTRTRVSLGPFIDDAIERAWHRCTGGRTAAAVTVEVSPREVVEVVEVQAATDDERRCLGDAVWAIPFQGPEATLDRRIVERHSLRLPRR